MIGVSILCGNRHKNACCCCCCSCVLLLLLFNTTRTRSGPPSTRATITMRDTALTPARASCVNRRKVCKNPVMFRFVSFWDPRALQA